MVLVIEFQLALGPLGVFFCSTKVHGTWKKYCNRHFEFQLVLDSGRFIYACSTNEAFSVRAMDMFFLLLWNFVCHVLGLTNLKNATAKNVCLSAGTFLFSLQVVAITCLARSNLCTYLAWLICKVFFLEFLWPLEFFCLFSSTFLTCREQGFQQVPNNSR